MAQGHKRRSATSTFVSYIFSKNIVAAYVYMQTRKRLPVLFIHPDHVSYFCDFCELPFRWDLFAKSALNMKFLWGVDLKSYYCESL